MTNGGAEDDTPPPAKKPRRSSGSGHKTNGHVPGPPQNNPSGDETVTDEDAELEAEEPEESEDDVEDAGEEDTQGVDGSLEELDAQNSAPPEDEALDNGDDSD